MENDTLPITLYKILKESSNEDIIVWSKDGKSIVIKNKKNFVDLLQSKGRKSSEYDATRRLLGYLSFKRTKTFLNDEKCDTFTHPKFHNEATIEEIASIQNKTRKGYKTKAIAKILLNLKH